MIIKPFVKINDFYWISFTERTRKKKALIIKKKQYPAVSVKRILAIFLFTIAVDAQIDLCENQKRGRRTKVRALIVYDFNRIWRNREGLAA